MEITISDQTVSLIACIVSMGCALFCSIINDDVKERAVYVGSCVALAVVNLIAIYMRSLP